MNDIVDVFAANIKKYRRLKGFTQEKLAELCGKSQNFVGDAENGRKVPSLRTIQLLANTLEVKPYQLLIPEDDERKNYYEDFFLNLKGKIDPGLFKAIEQYLKDKK